ncbi:histidinol dehydrogenase [Bacillus thuringiensis]|uniref:histidinol dehydrogenase n=1 Tax=Bacillus thuringiensis TaxID=1428 RepID=UPI000A36244A|nr:histidinol dehydrogenase [Bacillus thuringiensis]MED2124942.1 histidinol dehydrogenase [Bacillus thuringiensis]MED2147953.1 histidinol dehydrogenase [Bacillus thuringiensis]MED2171832.1 histidinol dehydrogenase [Bacillus thuringiensis]MED2476599.1 histidinol dehydrogenase [Bacillus thuringiensis]MED2576960.1 histidinol dehydrogenase [Bacillus thuringiensis]
MFRYFKFKLNDTVQFAENDGHMYRIVGYRLEKGFYPKDEWTHIIYELLREFDGYTMDAEEEELVKVVQVEDEYYKIQEVSGYLYPVKMKQKQQVMKIERMDDLLDAYNDYKRLADFFKDLSYEQKAEEVLLEMKRLRA